MSKDQDKTMHALIERHRSTIRALAQKRGISNVRVFGSMQRNDAKSDSNVDLLVELEAGRSGLTLGGFQLDVSELLGRRVDVLTEPALYPRIRDVVLREAQPL